MKTYNVLWSTALLTHLLHNFTTQNQTRRMVSELYKIISNPRAQLPERMQYWDLSIVKEDEVC